MVNDEMRMIDKWLRGLWDLKNGDCYCTESNAMHAIPVF
jgi:hypothetical protein